MTNEEAINHIKNILVLDTPILPGDYIESLDMAIEALKEKYWISIKEKMPDKLGEYLVQTENVKLPFSAWYEGNNIWTDSTGIETERVLAWRELPVSYRERDYD